MGLPYRAARRFTKGAELLQGGPLKVDELRARRASVTEMRRLLESWRTLLNLLRSYWATIEAIRNELGYDPPDLQRAEGQLVHARNELWSVASAADFDRYGTAIDLQAVEDILFRYPQAVLVTSGTLTERRGIDAASSHRGCGASEHCGSAGGRGDAESDRLGWPC